jgi:hypothetical protein
MKTASGEKENVTNQSDKILDNIMTINSPVRAKGILKMPSPSMIVNGHSF